MDLADLPGAVRVDELRHEEFGGWSARYAASGGSDRRMKLPKELLPQVERVNRLLATQQTMPHKLEAIAEVIERTVPGVDAAAVALVVEEATITGAASSQLAIEADLVQYARLLAARTT